MMFHTKPALYRLLHFKGIIGIQKEGYQYDNGKGLFGCNISKAIIYLLYAIKPFAISRYRQVMDGWNI